MVEHGHGVTLYSFIMGAAPSTRHLGHVFIYFERSTMVFCSYEVLAIADHENVTQQELNLIVLSIVS
jgi:hypothetical protein